MMPLASLPCALPFLYLLFALPLVVFQVFGTPPFQMPDEPRHFMRTVQIADGRLLGRRSGTDAGGELEAAVGEVATAFRPLAFDPDARLDPSVFARVAPLRWGASPKIFTRFENTAIYPPTLYLVGALGVRLGKAIGLPILETYYLARLLAGLGSVALATVAIGLCARGRTVLFVALSLPLTLSAFASVSQDGPGIAAGALAAAILSRAFARGEALSPGARAAAALALGAVVGARLPLWPLLALLVLPTTWRPWRRPEAGALAAAALALLPVGLGVLCAGAAKVPFRAVDGVDPSAQLAALLHDPGQAVSVLGLTLVRHGGELLQEMGNPLGWWGDMRPAFYHGALLALLAVAVAAETLSSRRGPSALAKAVLATAAAAAGLSVLATFYLVWTPVGGASIEGLQGRYFIVPAMVLALALPALPTGRSRLREHAGLAACAGLGLLNLWAVPMTILGRYYV